MTETQKLIDQFISNHKKLFPNKGEQTITISLITNKKNEIMNAIKKKEKSLTLLKELKHELQKNDKFACPSELLVKIKKDLILSKKEKLIKALKSIEDTNLLQKPIEDEELLVKCRKIIIDSYTELNDATIINISPLNFLKELGADTEMQVKPKNQKIIELNQEIPVSPSFKKLINEINQIPVNKVKKILSLLFNMYNGYFKQLEFSVSRFTEVVSLHNNLELLLVFLSYKLIFDEKEKIEEIYDYFVIFRNFSTELINQVMSNLISQLTVEMSEFNTFDNINLEVNYKKCQKMISSSLHSVFSFFDLFKEYAIERELIFNLNYVLSLYFDVLNRKILLVQDFNLNDIKSILNICQEIAPLIKRNIEKIAKDNMELSVKLMNVLEQNPKYKKFEEILVILNSNLKEIKNFVINSNFNIQIDKNELIDLIQSIFEVSENRESLIVFLNTNLGKKKETEGNAN